MPRRRADTPKRQAVARKFYTAIEAYRNKHRWDVSEMARQLGYPIRTVHNWLRHKSCPHGNRLRRLCRILSWEYETLFNKEATEDFQFEQTHLTYHELNRRYLSIRSRDPLESWNYVSLAGALLFNDLSAAGYECQAVVDHNFGVRISFHDYWLKHLGLRLLCRANKGLLVGWIDENGSIRGEPMDLSNSTLDLIKKNLHSFVKL